MTNHVISTVYYFMCVMLTSDVNCLFTPRSEENNGKKTEIIDQPRFHADTHSTSQKCPLISSLTPLFDSTNYLALFRSYQRAMIHCQTFSVARGERNAHFSVLAPRLQDTGGQGGMAPLKLMTASMMKVSSAIIFLLFHVY